MQRRSLLVSCAMSLALAAPFAACSSSSDAGPGTSPPVEAGAEDVAKKAPPPPLADASKGVCAPGELPGFTAPEWTPPTPFGQGKCTDEQVRAIVRCYFDESADQAACDTLINDAANQGCNDCLFTDASTKPAAAYGPFFIDSGGYVNVNVAGCVANFDGDTSASGCGAKYLAETVCEDEACGPNCSPTDDGGVAEYDACIDKAAAGVCKSFATAGACAQPLLSPGGKAEACLPTSGDFVTDAARLGALFCAGMVDGGVADGATDAPADAPSDGG